MQPSVTLRTFRRRSQNAPTSTSFTTKLTCGKPKLPKHRKSPPICTSKTRLCPAKRRQTAQHKKSTAISQSGKSRCSSNSFNQLHSTYRFRRFRANGCLCQAWVSCCCSKARLAFVSCSIRVATAGLNNRSALKMAHRCLMTVIHHQAPMCHHLTQFNYRFATELRIINSGS